MKAGVVIFNFEEEIEKYGLTVKDYETVLSEIQKKMSGISDLDWKEIIDKYNIKCHYDSLRKASQTIFGGYFVNEYLKSKGYLSLPKNNLEEARELLTEQYIVKQQIHNDKLQVNRMKRELVPSLAIADELKQYMIENNFKVELPEYHYSPIVDNSKYTMICPISDLHIGYIINNCNGNFYNWDIANERIDKYLSECKRYIELYNINRVIVVGCGDYIEHSEMRYAQNQYVEFYQSEQINKAIKLIWKILTVLSETCNVVYTGVAGNHDRMNGDKKKEYEGNNANNIILEQLNAYVELSGTERIQIYPTDYTDKEIRMNINGLNFKFIHGDDISKLDKSTISNLISSDNELIDCLVVGHFHHFSYNTENHGRTFITNGCLSGFNTYSKKFFCSTSASQTMIIVGNEKIEIVKNVEL